MQTETKITNNWIMSDRPLVTIGCCTYNHEKYIKDAIESFLIQKTNFAFEVVIHDDASTDNTPIIISNYKKLYPRIIRPIFQNENQYSKKQGSISARFVWPHALGKYIALCEGDDYWTDPYKLQKQVDFLEANSEYSMCFHGAQVIGETNSINNRLFSGLKNKDYSGDELIANWIVPTASVVFRKEIINKIPQSEKFIFTDIITFLTMAAYGKVRCINELMSVYRRTPTGAVLSLTKNSSYFIRRAEHYKEISNYFPKISQTTIDKLIIDQYAGICKSYLKQLNIWQFFINFYKFLKEYRIVFLKGLLLSSLKSITIRTRKLIKYFY